MKGITPVIATILLLLIAVAVVGFAYGFISGFFITVTGKAAIISGASLCGQNGNVTIFVTNGGTGNIDLSSPADVIVDRTQGPPGQPVWNASGVIAPGQLGSIKEVGNVCKPAGVSQQTCHYMIVVGGTAYPTRADCF